MKYTIYCMNEAGRVVCGMVTSNKAAAAEYMQRKTEKGFITIKTVKQ